MITWEFYSKRKKLSLENFLKEVDTHEEAVRHFRKREITPPSNLKEFYEAKSSKSEDTDKVISETPKKPASASKRTTTTRKNSTSKKPVKQPAKRKQPSATKASSTRGTQKEPAQVLEETESKDDEKKLYFRKVIKPEKK